MDWSSITHLAREQGTVFWIATAAISLGATLLVVALIQGLRQRIGQGRKDRAAGAAAAAIAPPAGPPASLAPALDAAVRSANVYGATELAGEDEGSLALLLRRLQSAGDRLEEIASDLETLRPGADLSGLKSSLQDVEYVFRAGES